MLPSMRCRKLALPLVVLLWLVPACAVRERTRPLFPPSADLRVQNKPQLRAEDVDSEAALDRHDIALEIWGEAGWRTVGRICRWAVANGAELAHACPSPPTP